MQQYRNEEQENLRTQALAVRNSINKMSNFKITGISLLDNAISGLATKMKNATKRHFGLELSIPVEATQPKTLDAIYHWIMKYNDKASKILRRMEKLDAYNIPKLTNMTLYMHLDHCTYAIVKIGDDYRELLTSNNSLKIMLDIKRVADSDIYMYIFGKHTFKYYREMVDILNYREDDMFRMYNISGDDNPRTDVAFKSLYQDVSDRSMDTIFMEPGIIESITDHIDKYIANKDMYAGRGIIYKTGILLYGEPGTGKTSLIKALASKYEYDLILVDMATFNSISLDTFTHSINIDDKKYIVALEDIDCVIADRENEDADKDDKKVINKLLQFLDSNSSPNEVIFIASTNHVKLLDEALMREGRFDLKVEIKGIKEDKVREMCKSFDLSDNIINTIIDDIKASGIDLVNQTIRQSKLQSMILKYSGMNLRSVEDEIEENLKKEHNNDNE